MKWLNLSNLYINLVKGAMAILFFNYMSPIRMESVSFAARWMVYFIILFKFLVNLLYKLIIFIILFNKNKIKNYCYSMHF